ncbi:MULTISPECIES: DUF7315 family membrane protein [Saliphagus]|uniref:DUF7315 domain-containing protein n=1 Tax=Saliphagus infecundisoli TaxID=1849069 RepID=A0ABD5QF19_9EURY|nr:MULTISPECIES: hypothetical protein [Saliphagus]
MTDRDGRDGTTDEAGENADDGPDRHDVVVPLRLYKTVTVFSTLIAIVSILAGFALLDAATNRAQADIGEIGVGLSIVGVALIATGALTYAFSTRFRAAGMGNAKDEPDEGSTTNNGR